MRISLPTEVTCADPIQSHQCQPISPPAEARPSTPSPLTVRPSCRSLFSYLRSPKHSKLLSQSKGKPPFLVIILEPCGSPPAVLNSAASMNEECEALLKTAPSQFEAEWPVDECDPISLNYASGTTSKPKGVINSHRGAYLNAITVVLLNDMTTMPASLWTVPLFHCNGWCLTWGIAAQGGTNIYIRNVSAKKLLPRRVTVMTGAAPPPPLVLYKMEELGFHVHSYGLTETYGPETVCTLKLEWDSLLAEEHARLRSCQGLQHLAIKELDVKDPVSLKSVPADGKTMGEVMFRGNVIRNGYYNDLNATNEAIYGGWLRSGDLALRHVDGFETGRGRQI